jgi:hypothetical protein
MEMTKGMQKVIGRAILDLPMPQNDAVAKTVRDYLQRLLRGVWIDGEGFDGKRPFGNSDWQNEVYAVLVTNDFLEGDENRLPDCYVTAEELVLLAIDQM